MRDIQRHQRLAGNVEATVQCAAIVLHRKAKAGIGIAKFACRRGEDQLASGQIGQRHHLPGHKGRAVVGQCASHRERGDDNGLQAVGGGVI